MLNLYIPTLRLISQQLAGTSFTTPKELVAWMGAMQAQDYNMVKWAIGIRLPGFTVDTVEAAINSGELLRTHLLRPTWHLVAAEDIRWILALTAPRIKAATKSRDTDLGLAEPIFTKSNELIRKALKGNVHLTREELAKRLEQAGISTDSFRISHIMMRAELDAIVCSGAPRGKTQTYALLDERAPQAKPLTKDEALAKLAQRYFTSHSPANLQDFIWWSGLTTAEARQAVEMIRTDLISETIDSQIYWIDKTFAGQAFTANESAYLLPAFDEFIISYRDRTAVVPAENHSRAISSNGIFRPTVIHNGKVIGLWKKVLKKGNPTVETDFFKQPTKAVQRLVDKASTDFENFLTPKQ